MKGMFKVGNHASDERQYEQSNFPVLPTNFHLFFHVIPLLRKATYISSLKGIVMVGGSLPPRHETTTCRPR